MHYQGLHVATCQKHRGMLGARLIKRLPHLETAHNYARHNTEPMITSLVAELRDALILEHKARGVSDEHPAPSQAIEHVAPAPAVIFSAAFPVIELVILAPGVTYAVPSPEIEYVAPVPIVTAVMRQNTWHLNLMSPTQRPFRRRIT